MLRHIITSSISITLSISTGIGGIAVFSPNIAQAAFLYKLDTLDEDPKSQLFSVGLDPRPDYKGKIVGDLMWLNSYQVEPGGDLLKSISLTWGAPPLARPIPGIPANSGFSDWQNRSYPATVFLYSDPNNDGNPNDAKLLTQANTTIANPDTKQLTTVDIQPTQLQVGQKFFVGALFRNVERTQRPATANLSSKTADRSWFAIGNHGDNQPSNIDTENLSNNFIPNGSGQSPLPLPNVYGNWVLRAYADEAVKKHIPEPGFILGLGVVGAMIWKRRR